MLFRQYGTIFNGIAALLHQPLGSGSGTADAYRPDALQPAGINLLRSFDEMGIGVDTKTFAKEDSSVRALPATNEKYQVVATRKLRNVGHAVSH